MDLGNNLDELLNSRFARESEQVAVNLASDGTLHPNIVSSLPNQSYQKELPSSSHAFRANSLGYQDHTINHERPEWNSSCSFHQTDMPPTTDGKITVPSSVQYDYGIHTSNPAAFAENLDPNPIIRHMVPQEAPNVVASNANAKGPGVSGLEINLDNKTLVQKKTDSGKDRHSGTDVPLMDTQTDEESSIRRTSDSTKLQVDHGKTPSSDPYDVSSNNTKSDDAPAACAAGVAVTPVDGDYEVYNTKDHEPDILPLPVFRSERIHREQAEILLFFLF